MESGMRVVLGFIILFHVFRTGIAYCPGNGNEIRRTGERFMRTKIFDGGSRRNITGTYRCTCEFGGRTVCQAVDIPCYDSTTRTYKDLHERFRGRLFGRLQSCICLRGRSEFRMCYDLPRIGTAVTCTEFSTARQVGRNEKYVFSLPGKDPYECTCIDYETPGSCVRLEGRSTAVTLTQPTTLTPTQATQSTQISSENTGCTDSNYRRVRINGEFILTTRIGRSYKCLCIGEETIRCKLQDQCESRGLQCPQNSKCVRLNYGYQCRCNSGFQGRTCEDIDECAYGRRRLCARNAICTNTPGSYTCECEEGYSGDGYSCSEIDHCSNNYLKCDSNAHCESDSTTYTCICNERYTGNGLTCTELDLCSVGNECDDNARCEVISYAVSCTCNEGYSGNGRICRKMCRDEVSGLTVEQGAIYLKVNPLTSEQTACTCGEGGREVPGSCHSADAWIPGESITSTTESTITAAPAITSRASTSFSRVTCQIRGRDDLKEGESYIREFRGEKYNCRCTFSPLRSKRGRIRCVKITASD